VNSTDPTFANFIVGSTNQFAYVAAVAVSNNPGSVHNPLFIYGESGLGKTHLLKAIRAEVAAKNPGLNILYTSGENFLNDMIIHMGEKMAARFADEIIVLSRGVQQYFMDAYGRETVFIPNGVNAVQKKEAQCITEQYGLRSGDYFLYLSRLVPEKGLTYLVDAFSRLHTDKKLVIAGGSSDTHDYVNMLKEKTAKDPRVLFTDFVQGQVLEELYSNAYAYVLPSDLEGMPISLLEAMSYGNCCVTSDIIECADVIEDKGITFARGDTDALLEVLQDLCEHPEKVAAYQATAAEYITQRFHWDDVTQKTLELYQK
jgi:glycosyltransferase involved in cell wall biosynthesis